jgi:hypothetical protein
MSAKATEISGLTLKNRSALLAKGWGSAHGVFKKRRPNNGWVY